MTVHVVFYERSRNLLMRIAKKNSKVSLKIIFVKPLCGRNLSAGVQLHVVAVMDSRIKRNPPEDISISAQTHGIPDNTPISGIPIFF